MKWLLVTVLLFMFGAVFAERSVPVGTISNVSLWDYRTSEYVSGDIGVVYFEDNAGNVYMKLLWGCGTKILTSTMFRANERYQEISDLKYLIAKHAVISAQGYKYFKQTEELPNTANLMKSDDLGLWFETYSYTNTGKPFESRFAISIYQYDNLNQATKRIGYVLTEEDVGKLNSLITLYEAKKLKLSKKAE